MNNHDKKKYTLLCTNCGRTNHEYRNCKEPIISLGIILIKFSEDLRKMCDIQQSDSINSQGISIKNMKDIENFSLLRDNIKFLMIRRKHSIGYIDFIRGKYRNDNYDALIFLFQQMTKEEITKIGSMTFDELWNDFWDNSTRGSSYHKDYQISRSKFNKLKNCDETQLSLKFYVDNVDPLWNEAEWGFPKGRRTRYEKDINCAIREFEEETSFTDKDFLLSKGIKPLKEEFLGTNNLKYKYIYYVAIANSDKIPSIDPNNINQLGEIGDIGYFSYTDALLMIRDKHHERKKILTKLYMYIINLLLSELNNVNE